jgi:hypothetical protein
VTGTSKEGITAKAHELQSNNGVVNGRIEPLLSDSGGRTVGAGAGVELSDGSLFALMLVSIPTGYDVRLCKILREGETPPSRASELASDHGTWGVNRPLSFKIRWSDTDVSFDWIDSGTPARTGSFRIPPAAHEAARPIRFLLFVEKGNARFEGVMLEES